MPSGKVHDRITVTTAMLSVPAWYLLASTTTLPVYVGAIAAYIFSGYLLSDDLDTNSLALKRWGLLRFIWTPYRKLIPHRSWLSHGLIVGPFLRVLYLELVTWLAARGMLWLVNEWLIRINRDATLESLSIWIASILYHHSIWTAWCLAGLILGGLAHSLADWLWSGLKKIW
jgi:uncharacterized metal-binding protein